MALWELWITLNDQAWSTFSDSIHSRHTAETPRVVTMIKRTREGKKHMVDLASSLANRIALKHKEDTCQICPEITGLEVAEHHRAVHDQVKARARETWACPLE